ncbi:hypothetical protein CHS0354_040890 [Potamilus streckersoni]|uniref:C-type lectin domain-containing protein n=1 Tax=Potamilus streckersoni TaxID=2493646 RepID=A0AAE0SLV2_9BIVA|nr:hypothetical protein CHS0354_040890 [Potamilus streckersoni]
MLAIRMHNRDSGEKPAIKKNETFYKTLTLGTNIFNIVRYHIGNNVSFDIIFPLYHLGETWIGATDILIEGDWVWANSGVGLSSRGYTNWLAGETNNTGENENCLGLFNTGFWNDAYCDTHLHYICEKEAALG